MFALPARVFFGPLPCFRTREDGYEATTIIIECLYAPLSCELTIFKSAVFHGSCSSKRDFNVYVIDATLGPRMIVARMPWAAARKDVGKSGNIEAAPLATGRKPRTT